MTSFHIIVPTSDLVLEMLTYEAYFGFYPGGIKAVVRDTLLGCIEDRIVWSKKEKLHWQVRNDVLAKCLDFLEMEENNLDKSNSHSAKFTELAELVVTAVEELREHVSNIVLSLIGNKEALILERGPGNRWLGNDLLIRATLI